MTKEDIQKFENSIFLRWIVRGVGSLFMFLIVWVAKDIAGTVDSTANTVQGMAREQAVYGLQQNFLVKEVADIKAGVVERTRDRITKTEANEVHNRIMDVLGDHEQRIRATERIRSHP